MQAKYLFRLEEYPDLELWYMSTYGCGLFIVLEALDDSFADRERHPIMKNDLLICKATIEPTRLIYEVSEDFNISDLGKITSISKDMKL
ncbi:MAG: hypothetical protein ACK5M3_08115 [Dysgonomonas sp.]